MMIKIFILIIFINNYYIVFSSLPPCCRDMLGSSTCSRMWKNNKKYFVDKCNTNVEFRLLQCCSTCNKDEDSFSYDVIIPLLINESCRDRYSKEYCDKFIKQAKDNYSIKYCSDNNIGVTFRTCRKSCGYCGDNSTIEYSYNKAMESCYNQKLINREKNKIYKKRRDLQNFF